MCFDFSHKSLKWNLEFEPFLWLPFVIFWCNWGTGKFTTVLRMGMNCNDYGESEFG